jgi:hypothetical protein
MFLLFRVRNSSYSLNVTAPFAVLTAETVFGALRGLETFSQLIQHDPVYGLVRLPLSDSLCSLILYLYPVIGLYDSTFSSIVPSTLDRMLFFCV